MSKERKLINEMDKIIIKKYKPTEYLDRDEVHEIIDNNTEWNEDDTLKDIKLIDLEDQICQLKPRGEVIFEGTITLGGDNGLTKYAGEGAN